MIKVCGHRILVRPILLEESRPEYLKAKELGLILARDSKETAREHESVDTGVVLQVGPTAWLLPEHGGQPWAQVGQTVVYARNAGKLIIDPDTQEKFIALNDEDIVAVTKEAE